MNVLIAEPGYAPYEKEIDSLDEMQAVVGGQITASYPYDEPVAIVSNDESILLGMEFNRSIEVDRGSAFGIFGPFFVCGLEADHFCGLTPEQMETYKKKFHHAEVLLALKGDTPITLKVEPRRKDGAPVRDRKPGERER